MDQLDQKLLNLLQSGLEFVPRPYLSLAEKLGCTEEETLKRIASLKGHTIRQISAIFDTKTLGYQSCLVAVKVPMHRVDHVAEVINSHPGVTHNYKRNHDYNLWFTIAIPPDSKLGLTKTVNLLGEMAEVDQIRLMPTLKLYKIGVQLDMTGQEETKAKARPTYTEADRLMSCKELTSLDIAAIKELQTDLSLVPRPFDNLAENIGLSVKELLAMAKAMIDKKQMRRFSAVLNHRQAGFRFNGMGVWAVPNSKTDQVGMQMAAYKAVSHCYLRPTYSDWPYTIFSMVHSRTMEECESILQAMEDETGITQRATLYSTKEYKKTRLSYFTPEIECWESGVSRREILRSSEV